MFWSFWFNTIWLIFLGCASVFNGAMIYYKMMTHDYEDRVGKLLQKGKGDEEQKHPEKQKVFVQK